MSSVDYFSEVNLVALMPPSDRFTVLAALPSQMMQETGDLASSIEVSFSVTGRPGVFTIETPLVFSNVIDPQADAFLADEDVRQAVTVIEALYAL